MAWTSHVGFVEAYGRTDTEALVKDLEIIPRRQIPYKGVVLEELDLDVIIARHPQLALVDELAHTNVPGSHHPSHERLVDDGDQWRGRIDLWLPPDHTSVTSAVPRNWREDRDHSSLFLIARARHEWEARQHGDASHPAGRWSHVIRVVVGESVIAVGSGLFGGVVLVAVSSRWLSGVLFQTSSSDPVVLVQTALILLVVSAIAVTVPTIRALRTNPAEVFRAE